jgi:hypothetical protein
MELNYHLDEILEESGLVKIKPVLEGKMGRVQFLSETVSICTCLARFEADDQVDYLLIDNPGFKSHLILINNKIPVVFAGYDELGKMEKYSLITGNSHSGADHYLFANRFILFMRYTVLIEG